MNLVGKVIFLSFNTQILEDSEQLLESSRLKDWVKYSSTRYSTLESLETRPYQENDLNPRDPVHSSDGEDEKEDETDDADKPEIVRPAGREDAREAEDVPVAHFNQ